MPFLNFGQVGPVVADYYAASMTAERESDPDIWYGNFSTSSFLSRFDPE